METQECIRTRRSVRKYKDALVDWEKVVQIVNAGKYAPSAGNLQNWKFIVVKQDAVRKKLAKASFDQDWMEDAPIHIIVVGEPGKSERFYGARGERLYTIQGCAAAVENMLLVAHDIGLGACWVGAFDESKVRRAVNMPESASPQAIIIVGYADEKPNMPAKEEVEHVVYLDKWAGRGVGYKGSLNYWSVRVEDAVNDTKKALKRGIKRLSK